MTGFGSDKVAYEMETPRYITKEEEQYYIRLACLKIVQKKGYVTVDKVSDFLKEEYDIELSDFVIRRGIKNNHFIHDRIGIYVFDKKYKKTIKEENEGK